MKLVYNETYDELLGYFKDGRESSLEYDKYVKCLYQNRDLNCIAQALVQYFEDFLDPTPGEITMFALEFGEESTEAYLKFLKSGENNEHQR